MSTPCFTVPGESFLAVLDALDDEKERIRLIVCRHEGGAAYMADVYGKLTGRPGVVMVTRGSGTSHAAGGIHTAFQDSTPMVVLVGQVERSAFQREAFQEVESRETADCRRTPSSPPAHPPPSRRSSCIPGAR